MKGAKQKLKGKNQIKKFRQIAEQLASEISALKDVVGIVFIGGLVRGFVDKSSDIDIIVFTNKRDTQLRRQIRSLGNAVEKQFNIDLDLEIHFLEDFKKQPWDEINKWEFSKARIVFDPRREVKKTFKEKLKVPKEFWIRRIAVCSEYLKWYCCPPKEGVGTVAQSWIDRGDLISAHYSLNYATDLLARLTFALNREFTPAPKWRMYYLRNLKWQPKGYNEHLKEALSLKSLSAKDFDRRLRAIRTTWHEILPKIKQETGFTPQLMTKYYVEKILHQTGALNKLGAPQTLEQIDL